MPHVTLLDGEKLTVLFQDSDGEITISFNHENDHKLIVSADMPDPAGRVGVLYEEVFETTFDDVYNGIVAATEYVDDRNFRRWEFGWQSVATACSTGASRIAGVHDDGMFEPYGEVFNGADGIWTIEMGNPDLPNDKWVGTITWLSDEVLGLTEIVQIAGES